MQCNHGRYFNLPFLDLLFDEAVPDDDSIFGPLIVHCMRCVCKHLQSYTIPTIKYETDRLSAAKILQRRQEVTIVFIGSPRYSDCQEVRISILILTPRYSRRAALLWNGIL